MLKIVGGAVFALMAAGQAQSQETITWRDNVGGWNIAVDRTIENSCFIISGFENNVFLRFQFNSTQKTMQFIVADMRWKSIETGRNYELMLAFDDRQPWSGDAKGYRWNDILPSLVLSVPITGQAAPDFIDDFTASEAVRVSYEGNEVANLELAGVSDAVAEMMDCQAAMSDAQATSSIGLDPFDNPT